MPVYRVNEQYRVNRSELFEWATSRRMGVAAEAFLEPDTDDTPLPTLIESLESGGVVYRLDVKCQHIVDKKMCQDIVYKIVL